MGGGVSAFLVAAAAGYMSAAHAEPPDAHVDQIPARPTTADMMATTRGEATPLPPPAVSSLAGTSQLPAGVSERAEPEVGQQAPTEPSADASCRIDDDTLRAVAQSPDQVERLAEPCSKALLQTEDDDIPLMAIGEITSGHTGGADQVGSGTPSKDIAPRPPIDRVPGLRIERSGQ